MFLVKSCFIFQLFIFINIHKHVQFNTITYKLKGKRVEPQVLKLIYVSLLVL